MNTCSSLKESEWHRTLLINIEQGLHGSVALALFFVLLLLLLGAGDDDVLIEGEGGGVEEGGHGGGVVELLADVGVAEEVGGEGEAVGDMLGDGGAVEALPGEPVGFGVEAEDGAGGCVGLGARGVGDVGVDALFPGVEGEAAEAVDVDWLLLLEDVADLGEDALGDDVDGGEGYAGVVGDLAGDGG